MRGALDGLLFGLPRHLIEARASEAAAKGDRDARLLLSALADMNRRSGRAPRSRGITLQLLASWCCPACGARARTANGSAGTVTCARGHARAAYPEERSPFLRKLLNRA
jgi:hypothetical protein